jgi:hypothetical protein
MYDDDFLRSRGIEVVDNTPGEIADAAMELCDWTDGLDQSDAENDKLQRAILDLGGPAVSGARARMGRAFLRQNRHRLSISNA